MTMRLRQHHRRLSLTALLLLCLSASLWLQGEHIHLDGSAAAHHDCLVCHHSAAPAVNKTQAPPLQPQRAAIIATASPVVIPASATLLPPARAPPLSLA